MADMKGLKIAHFGNLANDAFPVVEALRKKGIDADLYVPFPQHVCSLPQWEVCSLEASEVGDPYDPDMNVLNKDFEQPPWLHFIYLPKKSSDLPRRWAVILNLMRKYDFIVAHVPFSIYAQFCHRPYVAFDAGAIRYFEISPEYSFYEKLHIWLFRRGYKRAKKVLMTNPDTLDLFHRFGFEPIFIPFLINTRRYKPEPCDALPFEYVFFMPSRQIWRDKGNDLFVEAFAQFLKEYRDSLLVMVDWGIDKERTKMLVQKLEVQKSVLWVPLMSKPLLVRWYNRSTAILDQVVLGSYGTSAPEAMACEKPVLIYISQKHYLKTFGEVPPVLNVKQPQEILEAMIRCTDSSFRSHIGRLSREWVEKHHSPEVVINRHIFVMSKVIQGVDNQ